MSQSSPATPDARPRSRGIPLPKSGTRYAWWQNAATVVSRAEFGFGTCVCAARPRSFSMLCSVCWRKRRCATEDGDTTCVAADNRQPKSQPNQPNEGRRERHVWPRQNTRPQGTYDTFTKLKRSNNAPMAPIRSSYGHIPGVLQLARTST